MRVQDPLPTILELRGTRNSYPATIAAINRTEPRKEHDPNREQCVRHIQRACKIGVGTQQLYEIDSTTRIRRTLPHAVRNSIDSSRESANTGLEPDKSSLEQDGAVR